MLNPNHFWPLLTRGDEFLIASKVLKIKSPKAGCQITRLISISKALINISLVNRLGILIENIGYIFEGGPMALSPTIGHMNLF